MVNIYILPTKTKYDCNNVNVIMFIYNYADLHIQIFMTDHLTFCFYRRF